MPRRKGHTRGGIRLWLIRLLLLFLLASASAIDPESRFPRDPFEEDLLRPRRRLGAVRFDHTDEVAYPGELFSTDLLAGVYVGDLSAADRHTLVGDVPSWLSVQGQASLESLLAQDVALDVHDIDTEGDLMVVASGPLGVALYQRNGSDYHLSQMIKMDMARGVALRLPRMYVSDDRTLRMYDVSDVQTPRVLGAYQGDWQAHDVVLYDDRAIISTNSDGLRVLNVTDPKNISLLHNVELDGFAKGMALDGNVLLVASGPDGLALLDVNASSFSLNYRKHFLGKHWQSIHWVGIDGPDVLLRDFDATVRFDRAQLSGSLDTFRLIQGTELGLPYHISGDFIVYRMNGDFKFFDRDRSGWGPSGILGKTDLVDVGHDMVVQDGFAYIAGGARAFEVVNCSDPQFPQVIYSYDGLESNRLAFSKSIAVSLNHAFEGTDAGQINVFDISNKANITQISTLDLPTHTHGIAYKNDKLYVGDVNKFHIVDVQNPNNPQILGSVNTPGWAAQLALYDQYAYVTERRNGVAIIDVSDPSDPTIVSTLDTPGIPQDIVIDDSYAYIAVGEKGVVIYSLQNPVAPILLDQIALDGEVFKVSVSGSRLYASVLNEGWWILDIKDPNAIRKVSYARTSTGGAYAIVAQNDHVYIGENSQFTIVRDRYDWQPGYVAQFDVDLDLRYVHFDQNRVFLPNKYINVVDVATPLDPKHISQYRGVDTGSWMIKVVTRDDVMFTVKADDLIALNISDVHAISEISRITHKVQFTGDPSVTLYNMAVHENTVYIGNYLGFAVIDVSDLSNMRVLGMYKTQGFMRSLKAVDQFLHVADGSGGYLLYNTSDPSSLQLLSALGTEYAYDVVPAHPYVYVADFEDGFVVIDISDPQNTTLVRRIATEGSCFGVDVDGSMFAIADYDGGLLLYDVTDPVAPALLTNIDTYGTQAEKVDLAEGYAYVADTKTGLNVVDTKPYQMNRFMNNATLVYVDGHTYYVQLQQSAFGVYDASLKLQHVIPLQYPVRSFMRLGDEVLAVTSREMVNTQGQRVFSFTRPGVAQSAHGARGFCMHHYGMYLDCYDALFKKHWSRVSNTRDYEHLSMYEDRLAVSGVDRGFTLFNTSAQEDTGLYKTSSFPISALAVHENHVYVLDPGRGLVTYLIGDSISQRSVVEGISGNKIAYRDGYVFITDQRQLLMVDVLDDRAPYVVHNTTRSSEIYDLQVGDLEISLALGKKGIEVLRPKNAAPLWQDRLLLSGTRSVDDAKAYEVVWKVDNVSLPFSILDQYPPRLKTPILDHEAYPNTPFTMFLPALQYFEDIEGRPMTLNVTGLPEGLVYVDERISGSVLPGHEGVHTIGVEAQDQSDAKYATSFALSVVNRAPQIRQSISDQTGYMNEVFSMSMKPTQYFEDPDGLPMVLSVTGLPGNLSHVGDVITGQVDPGSYGTHEVVVGVLDHKGLGVAQRFDIMVPNRAPQVRQSIPAQTFYIGQAVTLSMHPSLYFSDPDNLPMVLNVTGLPESLTYDTGMIQGSVSPEKQGVYEAKLSVSDHLGSEISSSMTINVPNRAPVFERIATERIKAGTVKIFDIQKYASDPDGDALSFNVFGLEGGSLPAWVDHNNSQLRLTPGSDDLGFWSWMLESSDSYLKAQSFIDVEVVNLKPFVSGQVPDILGYVGMPLNISFLEGVLSDQDDVLNYTLSGTSGALPRGMIFDAEYRRLIGAPLDVETQVLRFTGSDGQFNAWVDIGYEARSSLNVVSYFATGYTEDIPEALFSNSLISTVSSSLNASVTLIQRQAGRLSRSGYDVDPLFDGLNSRWVMSGLVPDVTDALDALAFKPSSDFYDDVTMVLHVDDGHNPAQAHTLSLLGVPVNDPPRILRSISKKKFYIGAPIQSSIVTELYYRDPEGSALDLVMSGFPSGLSFQNGLIQGVVLPKAQGQYNVSVRVMDAQRAHVLDSFLIDVPNQAPRVRQALPTETIKARTERTLSLSGVFEDFDGDALSYRLYQAGNTSLPAWVVHEGSSLTLAPDFEHLGPHSFFVEARDSYDSKALMSFDVVVSNLKPIVNAQAPDINGQIGVFMNNSVPLVIRDQDDVLNYTLRPRSGFFPGGMGVFQDQGHMFLIGTPEEVGVRVMRLIGSDGQFSASVEFMFDVAPSLYVNFDETGIYYDEDRPVRLPDMLLESVSPNILLSMKLTDRAAGRLSVSPGNSTGFIEVASGSRDFDAIRGLWSIEGQVESVRHQANELWFFPYRDYNRNLDVLVDVDDRTNPKKQLTLNLYGRAINDAPVRLRAPDALSLQQDKSFEQILPWENWVQDVDSAYLTREVVSKPSWVSLNNQSMVMTGTPSSEGRYAIEFRISDGEHHVSVALPLDVSPKASLFTRENLTTILPIGFGITLLISITGMHCHGKRRLLKTQGILARVKRQIPASRARVLDQDEGLNEVFSAIHRLYFEGDEASLTAVHPYLLKVMHMALDIERPSFFVQYDVRDYLLRMIQVLLQLAGAARIRNSDVLRARVLHDVFDIILLSEMSHGGIHERIKLDLAREMFQVLSTFDVRGRDSLSVAFLFEIEMIQQSIICFQDRDTLCKMLKRNAGLLLSPGRLLGSLKELVTHVPQHWYPRMVEYNMMRLLGVFGARRCVDALGILQGESDWRAKYGMIRYVSEAMASSQEVQEVILGGEGSVKGLRAYRVFREFWCFCGRNRWISDVAKRVVGTPSYGHRSTGPSIVTDNPLHSRALSRPASVVVGQAAAAASEGLIGRSEVRGGARL